MDDFPPFFAQQHAGLARLAYLITGDPVVAEDLAAATLVEVRRRWPRAVASGNPVVYARRELIKLTRTWTGASLWHGHFAELSQLNSQSVRARLTRKRSATLPSAP